MPFAITPLYVALAALILVVLSIRVIRLRRLQAVALGTGGDALLERAVRGHGNFTEYAPIGLLLMASAELAGAAGLWIHAIGIPLILGRLLHAWGLSRSRGKSIGRAGGIVLTMIAFLTGVGVNLTQVLGR